MRRFVCLLGSILCCACSGDATTDRTSLAPAITGGALPGAGGSSASMSQSSTIGGAPSSQPGQPPVAPPASVGEVCQAVRIDARPQTPDMLIVLDRSGSMGEQGRWDPSISALRSVTQQLQQRIRFGLALFPKPQTAAGGSPIDISDCVAAPDVNACIEEMLDAVDGEACAPGDIVVPVAPQNAAPIAQALDSARPLGGTPTPGTLEGLLTTFAAAAPTATGQTMAPASPKYILLVTDGQPTCPAGDGSRTTQADIDATNAAVEALSVRNVKTYVIGYDTSGPGNEMLAQVLDGLAMRGGTGDITHRPVEDEASLVTELERITGTLVDCSFVLEMAPMRADHVLVRLDGKQVNLGQADGWTLEGDRTVRIQGAACTTLQNGQPHAVDVEVQCGVVVPQ